MGRGHPLKKLRFLAALVFTGLAVYLVLHDIEWDAVLDHMGSANYALLVLAAMLLVTTIMLRALRWNLILQPPFPVSRWRLFGSLNVAYFLNNLLPLQVGDLGRAYLVSELERLSMSRVLSTIVVERVVDVLTLLVFLVFLALFIDIPSSVRTPSIILAVVFSTLMSILVVAATRREWALALADRLLQLAPAASRPKLRSMASSAVDGFAVLRNPKTVGGLAAMSALLWLSVGMVDYLVMRAFDLPLGYGPALFIVVATTFGFFIPSTPGSFGIYHAIVVTVLSQAFDIDKTAALSFALAAHLVFYLPPMFLGPLFLWTAGDIWRTTSFWTKLRELRGAAPAPANP